LRCTWYLWRVPPTICVAPATGDARLAAAVDAQERSPDLRAATLAEAAASGAGWVWVLDGTALPRPAALAALIAAAERLEPVCPPAALASRIVAADGSVAATHAPLATQGEPALALTTVGLRVLPVRAMAGGSLLVRPAALGAACGEPAMVWTARLLRDARGFLVPDSAADATRRADRAAARLLLGTALRPRERLRLAADLVERGISSRAAGRRARPGRPSRRSRG
jgi:hypothetical protein